MDPLKDFQFDPFITFDAKTKKIVVVPGLKFEAFVSPIYDSLDISFASWSSSFTLVVFLQPTCNPPILYESNAVAFVPTDKVLKIRLLEATKIVDETVSSDDQFKYPVWFPNNGPNSFWRYDQQFCEVICDALMSSKIETCSALNRIKKIDFNAKWKPTNQGIDCDNKTVSNYPTLSKDFDCLQICTKNHIRYFLSEDTETIDCSVIGITNKSSNGPFLAITSLYMSSSNIIVKEIKYQKSIYELVSEIGGHMGLFIGASLITLLEFFEFLVHFIFRKTVVVQNGVECTLYRVTK